MQAQWIRADVAPAENEYHEFLAEFTCEKSAVLKISSETDYAAYLNGQLVGCGQYQDLPTYKVYDEIDLTPFLKAGRNVLAVVGYFCHTETSCYTEKGLGILFEVTEGDKVLACSGAHTPSRTSRTWKREGVPLITLQLGYSYSYDFEEEDGWLLGETEGFAPSAVIPASPRLWSRPVPRLEWRALPSRIVRAGSYEPPADFASAAEFMQRASLSEEECDLPLPEGQGISFAGKNVYLLADLGEENAGVLAFDIEVPESCELYVGYGEHIADGRVRTSIEGRCFQLTFSLRAGRNRFVGPFRRLGCRYLCAFLSAPSALVRSFGIIATEHSVTERPAPDLPDGLLRQIYSVCLRTLRLCMHEHYEDTPWREQALYAMDSRNQMLCGYYVFEDYSFARASLKLMSENLRPDGFFTLTTPRTTRTDDLTIPGFSLVQVCAMEEYARYSGDMTLFAEYEETYRTVMENFAARVQPNGLLKAVKGKYFWNFYEWNEGMDGNFYVEPEDRYELPLNAFYILALRSYCSLLGRAGKDASVWKERLALAQNAAELFYDVSEGKYADFMENDGTLHGSSELSHSLMALAGENSARRARAAELLAEGKLLPITLSHSIYKYEALLSAGEKYRNLVIAEISKLWGKMLGEGATTFYEDARGEAAFGGAGSLSHGWSAIPAYILHLLFPVR